MANDELRLRVPEPVAYRRFGDQLVLLNVETGQYHGLNPTARRMFEAVVERSSTAGVATLLAQEYGRPETEISSDLDTLCQALIERGLLERIEPDDR
jgi:hypothetical protein